MSREAIHLYVLPAPAAASNYVTASYADGSPASCRVRVNGVTEISTNRYGLARLPGVGPMDLRAEDGQGARGHLSYDAWWSPPASVQTNKTIYRTGEAIRATVKVRDGEKVVLLDVSSDGKPLVSRPVPVSRGAAVVEIPWQKEFAGAITLTVAAETNASRTILFPPAYAMKLAIQAARTTYRPGEEATVSFTARSSEGDPLEAALGVAVVDAAVGARARSPHLRYPAGCRRLRKCFPPSRAKTWSTSTLRARFPRIWTCSPKSCWPRRTQACGWIAARGLATE